MSARSERGEYATLNTRSESGKHTTLKPQQRRLKPASYATKEEAPQKKNRRAGARKDRRAATKRGTPRETWLLRSLARLYNLVGMSNA
jgi:hypothetical protein